MSVPSPKKIMVSIIPLLPGQLYQLWLNHCITSGKEMCAVGTGTCPVPMSGKVLVLGNGRPQGAVPTSLTTIISFPWLHFMHTSVGACPSTGLNRYLQERPPRKSARPDNKYPTESRRSLSQKSEQWHRSG